METVLERSGFVSEPVPTSWPLLHPLVSADHPTPRLPHSHVHPRVHTLQPRAPGFAPGLRSSSAPLLWSEIEASEQLFSSLSDGFQGRGTSQSSWSV